MIRKIILVITMLVMQVSFGQGKTRADRFFEAGDYINAAQYYEEGLKGTYHKRDLEQLSICYYNTFQYRKAVKYLQLLVNGQFRETDKSYDNMYNFKLYQMLSALGNYENGLDYFKLFKEGITVALDTSEAIETIEEFKLKTPDYSVKKVAFNSDASDFGAVKFKDTVYFVSDRDTKQLLGKKYKWTHQPFLDIYGIKVTEKNNPVGEVKLFSNKINSKLHEGNFCFSKDGTTLYISKSNLENGKKEFDKNSNNNIHLYKATLVEGVWSALEKLPFNQLGFSYQHPVLSPDGKKLYFSSDREGGFGGFDLYFAEVNDSLYGEPINLGAIINTPNREHFPFISKEGNLFFSSNGHLGLGMLDNFVSELVNGEFTTPINLGVPINSKYDDFNINYYSSTKGFFASNRLRINDDIFQFEQTGEIFIREYINIFEVRNAETKKYIPNSEVELLGKKGNTMYSNTLDSNAFFNVNLLTGNYRLKAISEGYQPGQRSISVVEKQDQKHVLYLKKIPPPPPPKPIDPIEVIIAEKKIDKKLKEEDPKRFKLLTDDKGPQIVEKNGKLFFELEPIFFDFDMWNIKPESKKILDALAQKLERYPNIHLKISSHTDSRGTVRYNQILSERRAESTRNYLALQGYINARRLQFKGFGELEPIVSCPLLNCTDKEHQLNRRSEFEIVKY